MARPGLMIHPKFRRGVYLLRCSPALLRGSLECIWDVAYENGDPLIGDAVDVELAAHWQGEPGRLCEVLVEAGFLDQTENGYEVHDLYDHAPDYVQRRLQREIERRERGQERKNRFSHRSRKPCARWRQAAKARSASDGAAGISPPKSELDGLIPPKSELDAPPAPAPAPAPKNPPTPLRGESQIDHRRASARRKKTSLSLPS